MPAAHPAWHARAAPAPPHTRCREKCEWGRAAEVGARRHRQYFTTAAAAAAQAGRSADLTGFMACAAGTPTARSASKWRIASSASPGPLPTLRTAVSRLCAAPSATCGAGEAGGEGDGSRLEQRPCWARSRQFVTAYQRPRSASPASCHPPPTLSASPLFTHPPTHLVDFEHQLGPHASLAARSALGLPAAACGRLVRQQRPGPLVVRHHLQGGWRGGWVEGQLARVYSRPGRMGHAWHQAWQQTCSSLPPAASPCPPTHPPTCS